MDQVMAPVDQMVQNGQRLAALEACSLAGVTPHHAELIHEPAVLRYCREVSSGKSHRRAEIGFWNISRLQQSQRLETVFLIPVVDGQAAIYNIALLLGDWIWCRMIVTPRYFIAQPFVPGN